MGSELPMCLSSVCICVYICQYIYITMCLCLNYTMGVRICECGECMHFECICKIFICVCVYKCAYIVLGRGRVDFIGLEFI